MTWIQAAFVILYRLIITILPKSWTSNTSTKMCNWILSPVLFPILTVLHSFLLAWYQQHDKYQREQNSLNGQHHFSYQLVTTSNVCERVHRIALFLELLSSRHPIKIPHRVTSRYRLNIMQWRYMINAASCLLRSKTLFVFAYFALGLYRTTVYDCLEEVCIDIIAIKQKSWNKDLAKLYLNKNTIGV
jgi:hypothetical protein